MALAVLASVLAICATWLFGLKFQLDHRANRRAYKDNLVLGTRLEDELQKINELKSKLDALALRVGLR